MAKILSAEMSWVTYRHFSIVNHTEFNPGGTGGESLAGFPWGRIAMWSRLVGDLTMVVCGLSPHLALILPSLGSQTADTRC